MTTVAYHHQSRTVAVDSRVTNGSTIVNNDFNKLIRKGDDRWIVSGNVALCQSFVDSYYEGKVDKDNDSHAILIKDNKAYYVNILDGKHIAYECKCNEAIGSGWAFALAAMDLGKNAIEAVEYAMTRDTHTGGFVEVYHVLPSQPPQPPQQPPVLK